MNGIATGIGRALLAVLALVLAGTAMAKPAAGQLLPLPQIRMPVGQITLVRGVLLRDGQPWAMKGVKFVGRVTPETALAAGVVGKDIRQAHARFGPQLPARVIAFGADTVSLEVSEYGLDPQHPIHDPAYRQQVAEAIRMFRAGGLTVMISMQWERAAGMRGGTGMPTDGTTRAWTALLEVLPREDAGLVLDLFNEPSGMPGPDSFAAWQQAHDALIAAVRQAGFHQQVVVVSGLRGAEWLDGTPPIADPDGHLVFGVHPQLSVKQFGFDSPDGWDAAFGHFCRSHPCLATEWTLARRPDEPMRTGCSGDAPKLAQTLLAYLWARRMGVVGWSFDFPGTLFAADDPDRVTDFSSWAGTCEASVQPYGNGQMLRDWFRGHGG